MNNLKTLLVSTLFLLVITVQGCGQTKESAVDGELQTKDGEIIEGSRELNNVESEVPGAASLDELKQRLLTHCMNHDVDSALNLFYLEGASQRTLELYRRAIPSAESGPSIATVSFEAVEDDDSNATNHTLPPIKKLMIEFGHQEGDGPTQVSQYFYVGTLQDRYYLVVPRG